MPQSPYLPEHVASARHLVTRGHAVLATMPAAHAHEIRATGWGDIVTPETPVPGEVTHQVEIRLYGTAGFGVTLEQAAHNWFNLARDRLATQQRGAA